MKIIKERTPVTELRRTRVFDLIEDPNCGLAFDLDKEGMPIFRSEEGRKNFELAISRPDLYEDKGIVTDTISYTEPAEGRCSCGKTVILDSGYSGAVQCHGCGRWYNPFGQQLLDPKYWEDEDDEY